MSPLALPEPPLSNGSGMIGVHGSPRTPTIIRGSRYRANQADQGGQFGRQPGHISGTLVVQIQRVFAQLNRIPQEES